MRQTRRDFLKITAAGIAANAFGASAAQAQSGRGSIDGYVDHPHALPKVGDLPERDKAAAAGDDHDGDRSLLRGFPRPLALPDRCGKRGGESRGPYIEERPMGAAAGLDDGLEVFIGGSIEDEGVFDYIAEMAGSR